MRQLKINKSITNRDAASLDKYLQDISKLPLITVEEEILLAQRIRDGDNQALEKLTSANLRFVVSVAKQYQNQGINLADLINEGNVGLIKAASRFDETRGFKFISYAVWWIRQSIMQAISEQSRMVRLPFNKITELNKIRKTQDILEQQLEREPSNAEIGAALDITEEQVIITRSASGWHVSTDAQIPGGENTTLLDIVSDPESEMPDAVLMNFSRSIEIDRVLATLTAREKDIIVLSFGIGGISALSLTEIGEKYALTRERVRQIKEKAIRKLKNGERNKNLRPFL